MIYLMYRPIMLATILDFPVRNQDKRPFHKMLSHQFKLGDVDGAFAEAEWAQRQTQVLRAVLVP